MDALFVAADFLEGTELNSSYYRCLIPAKYLELAGHDVRVASGNSVTFENAGQADTIDYTWIPETVVLERVITPDRIKKLREAGAKRIIVTFDDHYGIIPKDTRSYRYWHTQGGYKEFLKALPLADLVIVPSLELVGAYSKYCRRIENVPNFIDPTDYQGIARLKTQPTVIGWGGTRQHRESWRGTRLAAYLKRVQEHLGDRINIVIYDDRVAGEFLDEAGVVFEHRPTVPIKEWAKHLACFDIGLAPLFGDYDLYRSNLKLIEYAALGIPFVASSYGPYLTALKDGWKECGYFVRGEAWVDCLIDLVDNPESYKDFSDRGIRYATVMGMDKNIQVYEKLLWGNQ